MCVKMKMGERTQDTVYHPKLRPVERIHLEKYFKVLHNNS